VKPSSEAHFIVKTPPERLRRSTYKLSISAWRDEWPAVLDDITKKPGFRELRLATLECPGAAALGPPYIDRIVSHESGNAFDSV